MIARVTRGPQASRAEGGQSLVEFALILPLLLVILLGVADLGRVFQSAITTEAAVRDSAEAAAQEYIQIDGTTPAPGLDAAGYAALHTVALDVACREAERLPARVLAGSQCLMPVIAVCVHDDSAADPLCDGSEASSAPQECTEMDETWDPTRLGPGLPYVEVRMCYRFDPLISVPLFDWGSIWLQKSNFFTVANY